MKTCPLHAGAYKLKAVSFRSVCILSFLVRLNGVVLYRVLGGGSRGRGRGRPDGRGRLRHDERGAGALDQARGRLLGRGDDGAPVQLGLQAAWVARRMRRLLLHLLSRLGVQRVGAARLQAGGGASRGGGSGCRHAAVQAVVQAVHLLDLQRMETERDACIFRRH